MNIVVVTPVYNDQECLEIFIKKLEELNSKSGNKIKRIVAVNDGSSGEFILAPGSSIDIRILNLNVNMGHQRAISIGLSYIYDTMKDFDYVIVSDSDGEDKPEDIPLLIQKCGLINNKKIIFAARKKRTEDIKFRILYLVYKWMFILFTKKIINFGNFSCIPSSLLRRVVSTPDSWNHYSGSVIKSRIPFETIPIDRGKRYLSKSKMNLHNLVIHGFSSISIYLDIISIRILLFCTFGMILSISFGIVVLSIKLFTNYSIPGWASGTLLTLINLIGIFFLISLLILLMQLNQRNRIQTPPYLLYKNFIFDIQEINSIENVVVSR